MQSKCNVLPGKTANTPDGSNAPEPMPILMRIDGGLSSVHIHIQISILHITSMAQYLLWYKMIFNYVVIKMTNYTFKCDGCARPAIIRAN